MSYIHGTHADEQRRLAALNALANPPFLEFLDLQGAESVLEVGSGLGVLAREVAQRTPAAEVVGIEFSAAQIAAAGDDLPANLRLVQGDAHELPFPDGRFDVVYCRWVLEHVARPEIVTAEMRRVLKTGGRVFVQENDISLQRYDPPTPRFDEVWRKVARMQEALGGDALIGAKLFRLLQGAGFKDISISLAPDVYWSGTPGFYVWIDNEIAILQGCQEELIAHRLATLADIETAIAELAAVRSRTDASTWFAWNRATGTR